jgi:hypothetical protein
MNEFGQTLGTDPQQVPLIEQPAQEVIGKRMKEVLANLDGDKEIGVSGVGHAPDSISPRMSSSRVIGCTGAPAEKGRRSRRLPRRDNRSSWNTSMA